MDKQHQLLIERIAGQAAEYYKRKVPFKVFHGSTNSTRILAFKRSQMIDISELDRVLAIDESQQTAWVEPNVPMDKLVAATLKKSLVPKVVMEFPGITVGGGIQGGAGESSSFRYGCFNQICNRYEMILANGEITEVSAKNKADLFYGTAGSFGTLGIITAAEVQLLPVKKYVQLTYLPVTSFEESVAVLQRVVTEGHDYIDGIMFAANNGVIIVGKLADNKVGKVERFSRARDEWYYLHAEQISKAGAELTESVPIVDYLFRYDRGAFWVGRYAFDLFHQPFNRLTRTAYDRFFHTRKLYEALQASGGSQRFIVQDLALPEETATKFMEFIDRELQIYPLWLCPFKIDDKSPFQSNNLRTKLGINVGVWGNYVTDNEVFIKLNRAIEGILPSLGGKKWFYAHSYYSRDEFWAQYDKPSYDRLRHKYHAENLPDIYDKIRVKDHYPVDFKGGAMQAMRGKVKLRISD